MRQVTKYTEAIKASVLSKALAPNAPGVIELAKEFNIPKATIYTWLINMKNKNKNDKKEQAQQRPKDRSPAFKLKAVMDTLGKSEEEQSAYCRTHGVYYNHIESWRQQILESLGAAANTVDKAKEKENKAENQRIQDEMKALKSDLKRKDKALAEVTALLVLKKKANLLWGESEDD